MQVEELIQELKDNDRNRKKMFEEKFPEEIRRQSELRLKEVTDSGTKNKILAYFNHPSRRLQLQERLRNDPKISKFFEEKKFNKKSHLNSFDEHFENMLELMKKKASNNNEPITFYNQYTLLYKNIKNSFILRKNFKEQKKDEKEEKYEEMQLHKPECPNAGCKASCKNNSGIKSHLNYCKFKKLKEADSQVRRRSTRASTVQLRSKTKLIHKEGLQ